MIPRRSKTKWFISDRLPMTLSLAYPAEALIEAFQPAILFRTDGF
jgi:hypothetical protein